MDLDTISWPQNPESNNPLSSWTFCGLLSDLLRTKCPPFIAIQVCLHLVCVPSIGGDFAEGGLGFQWCMLLWRVAPGSTE